MKSVMMIMNARAIPECIGPLRSLRFEKVWFRGFMQKQVEREMRGFIQRSAYDRYILVSDDVVMTEDALNHVLRWQPSFDILTGWCNLSPTLWRANVLLHPISKSSHYRISRRIPRFAGRRLAGLVSGGVFPFKQLYDRMTMQNFPPCSDIAKMPEVFETYFMGGPLLSMKRGDWLAYGYDSPDWGGPAFGADIALSKQIAESGKRMWCVRDAFVYHLHTTRNFLVGRVTPEVICERTVIAD